MKTSNKQQATINFKFSEKLILFILLFTAMVSLCQEKIINAEPYQSPQGYFDHVFDKDGTSFNLSTIVAEKTFTDKLGVNNN